MKLAGRETARFCKDPDTRLKGALIYGPDAGIIAVRRRELTRALLGEEPDDMRVSQINAADVRKDASLLDTELKARGFFPGRRVVIVESATDGMSKTLSQVLDTVESEDAFLVLTAGQLPARSSLRKLFETDGTLASLQQFQDAPGPTDIEDLLRVAGLKNGASHEGISLLAEIAQSADYGSFLQLIDIISIYGSNETGPLSAEQISLIAPAAQDAEVDLFVEAVAHGNAAKIGPLLKRLQTGGTNVVTLLIALQRQFRQMLMVSSAPGGPEAGIALVKPPLWGARKSSMQSLMRRWQRRRLEQANQILFETDSNVRSSGNAPDMAVLERCALRLAMMGRGAG